MKYLIWTVLLFSVVTSAQDLSKYSKIIIDGKTAYMHKVTGNIEYFTGVNHTPNPTVTDDKSYADTSVTDLSSNNNVIIVAKGDTVYSLAKNNNMSVSDFCALNNIEDKTAIKIGQRLYINTTSSDLSNYSSDSVSSHTVLSGETLYSISKKYNTTVLELRELNNLSDNMISVGQILLVK